MSRTSLLKAAWLALVFAGIAGVSSWGRELKRVASSDVASASLAADGSRRVQLAGGGEGLVDANGHVTPLKAYRRIASSSIVADELLIALAEPERIAALSEYGRTHTLKSQLYGARPELQGPGELEALREAHIDLLVLNHMGTPAELSRVRELGIEVFNLGEMRGLTTLLGNIAAVAVLLGDRERGVRLQLELTRRMRAVAADVPRADRKRALYVSAYAGQLFGGAAYTSYHDVLTAAGLVDVAAERYRDWPHLDPEQLLALDPELIVTTTPSAVQLCRIAGLARLRACSHDQGIIAFDDAVIGNPGLGMLDAAEELRERVYGPVRP